MTDETNEATPLQALFTSVEDDDESYSIERLELNDAETFDDTIEDQQLAAANAILGIQNNPTIGPTATMAAPKLSINGLDIDMKADADAVISTVTITHKKEERKDMSSKNLSVLMENATKNKHTKYEDLTMTLTDASKLDDNYHLETLIDKTKECHTDYDMHDVFEILLVDPTDPTYKKVTGSINLYTNYAKITPAQVALSNTWYNKWPLAPTYSQNLHWTYMFFRNHTSDDLFDRVYNRYKRYPEKEQGGPLFFILLINQLLSNTAAAAESLRTRVENFQLNTLQGEDVDQANLILRGALNRLEHVNKMPDHVELTLTRIMQTSSVPEFNEIFHYMELQHEAEDEINVTGITTKPFRTVDQILTKAVAKYRLLVEENKWNSNPSSGKSVFLAKGIKDASQFQAKFQVICWNCGGGHALGECKITKNEVKIQQARDKFMQNKKERRNKTKDDKPTANHRSNGGRGRGGGIGRNNTAGRSNNKSKWARPQGNEPTRKRIDDAFWNFDSSTRRWVKEEPASAHVAVNTATSAPNSTPSISPPSMDVPTANMAMQAMQVLQAFTNMNAHFQE
jgi:hypothetical protein